MKQTSFAEMNCPIARTIEKTSGWSILILRDALKGITRFDQFQHSLGIPPSSLARALAELVQSGLLQRREYSEHPLRHDYLLTESGRDFLPVLVAMQAWGLKHARPARITLQLTDRRDGHVIDPVLVDRRTGVEITDATAGFRAGPDADLDSPLTNLLEATFASRAQFAEANHDGQ